jgi:triosephosphate isomerase (TIM)
MAVRPLVAGNWKMNGLRASLAEVGAMARAYDSDLRRRVDLLVCPPATLLFAAAATALGSQIAIGAQDCHEQESGAFTGSLSAEMLADAGATFVIVGHSERRCLCHDSDEIVHAKARAAIRAGLIPIVCVGETQAQREAGRTLEILSAQIAASVPSAEDFVVAYEPVWAIGSGLTPAPADVAEAHGFIRSELDKKTPGCGAHTRILYGGSVKPSNAKELMAVQHVDGALVGGASLRAADFMAIADAYR